jgi:hypothetical protein
MDPDVQLLRSRIEHEDNLINQRVSWLVSSQSFLLTGFAIAANGPVQDPGLPAGALRARLMSLLPGVGIACAVLVLIAMFGGFMALGELRRIAKEKFTAERTPLIVRTRVEFLGISAPAVLPVVFLLTWIAIVWR